MKVQAINSRNNFAKNFNLSFAKNVQKPNINYQNDIFTRQNSQIAFTGSNEKHNNKEDDLGNSLKNVDVKGMPFLLGLVTSAAMVKMGEKASELLCDDNGYLITEDSITSDLVNIDLEEQVLEFKGTGIMINADNYDYVDWENGIFKNYDGSVDINLSENKFIDTINGIFVDPEEKISAVLDNGRMQGIAIPSFGSGYPTCPWDDRWQTMPKPDTEEPEDPFKKASKYIKGLFEKDSMPKTDSTLDIFGNEIIAAKDSDGDTYLASYLQKEIDDNPVFAEFKSKFGKEAATEKVNGERLQQYIEKKYPSFGTRVLVYEGGRNATGGGYTYIDFNVADADKDGKLSAEELQNYLKGLSKDGKGKLDKEGTSKFLQLFDKNHDGKITLDEIIKVMDLDGNGSVSFDELSGIFDLNGDGTTKISEVFEGLIKLIFRKNK